MRVRYKRYYVYGYSCRCISHEPIQMRGNTALCGYHLYRVFVIWRRHDGGTDE